MKLFRSVGMERAEGGYGAERPAFVCWQKDVGTPPIDVTYSRGRWGQQSWNPLAGLPLDAADPATPY